jgi:exodeoxyribonuclease X
MTTALIFDTETTGLKDPEIIEAAWLRLSDIGTLNVNKTFVQRFKPSKPIELGALATHHILDEELANCSPSNSFSLPEDTQYLIGHNIDYDWNAIGKPNVKRICTQAFSRSLWPEADSHSQSAMIYLLERDLAKGLLTGAHSALADVNNCRYLLQHILKKLGTITDWESLWVASEAARIPKVIAFGKHNGTAIKDLPRDYVNWLRKQPELDSYLLIALDKQK